MLMSMYQLYFFVFILNCTLGQISVLLSRLHLVCSFNANVWINSKVGD